MMIKTRLGRAFNELRQHAPFTLFGALTGILCMFICKDLGTGVHHTLFLIFHPAHVLLSAVITASLFKLRSGKTNLVALALVGYFGSIGVATLSDCVVPFIGETVMGVSVPLHSQMHAGHDHGEAGDTHQHGGTTPDADNHSHDHDHDHEHDHIHIHAKDHDSAAEHVHTEDCEHHHGSGLHLGFIEDWAVVNPAAFLGILLAFWIPHEKLHTKLPHAGHVLVSTWASSFYVLMNTRIEMGTIFFVGMFVVLFIAVWLPCCISDIVFPILFVGPGKVPVCCPLHGKGSTDE